MNSGWEDNDSRDEQPDIVVLGPVATLDDGSPAPVRGQQGKVLALLVAAHPGAVTVDSLVHALWGDAPPSTARTGLGVVLHRLRERIGATDAIVHEHLAYRLTVTAERLDVAQFEQRYRQAHEALDTGDPDVARTLLSGALDLWRGDAYQPFDDDELLRDSAAALNEQRRTAEDLLFRALLETGRTDEAATWAQRLVSATPYREARWHALALSLYHCQRQAEALRSIVEAGRILREDIGVELGPELRRLEQDILDQQVPSLNQQNTPNQSGNAFATSETVGVGATSTRMSDPETTFVGRDETIAEVANLLDATRFVTVLAGAGAGKTRLASRLARSYPRRVVWVDLAALGPDDVLVALANELGVSANSEDRRDRVRKELATEPTLVVLDNCEHLVAEATGLARIVLESAPTTSCLTTSRVALGDPNENCYVLPTLTVDDGSRLLLDRAFGRLEVAIDRDQVRMLVSRLDANPLLIELVAEPVRALSVEAVNEQLERVLGQSGLPNSDRRHTSLAAAIDWSVNLLDPPVQELFATLGVMRGAFGAAEVAAISRDAGDDVEHHLETLCRHGLLATERRTGHTFFRQPEAVGIEARRRLVEKGGDEQLAQRHADTFLELAQDATNLLWSADEPKAVEKLAAASGQLAAVHERLVSTDDVERAATFAIRMWDYSFLRLETAQFGWASDVLKVDGIEALPNYPDLLGTAAMAAWAQNDFSESLRLADAAAAISTPETMPLQALRARFNVASFREPDRGPIEPFNNLIMATIERGEPHLRCDLEVLLALGLFQIGEIDGADQSAARAVATAESTMNPSCLAWASYGHGWTLLYRDPSAASRLFLAAARQARTVGNRFVEAMARGGLATSARRQGRPNQARALLIESIENWDRLQSTPQLIRSCREAVLLLNDMGDTGGAQRAATMLELVDLGHPMAPEDQQRLDELVGELGYLDEPMLAHDESFVVEILRLLAA